MAQSDSAPAPEAFPNASAGGFLAGNPALLENPYAVYAMLRGTNPVFRLPIPVETGAGVWLLTRHADVESVLRDKRSSANRAKADVVRLYRDALPSVVVEGPGGAGSMLTLDPPEHTRIRGLVSKAFTPRRVEALRPRIEKLVDELLDEMLASPECDLIHDLAEPLPAVVIAELLGVPPEDHRKFRAWSSKLIDSLPAGRSGAAGGALGSGGDAGGGGADGIEEHLEVILDYLRGIIAERRKEPRDDLISALIEAQEDRDALSDGELVATAFLLLAAGHETTTNLIGNGTLALAQNPEQWERLRSQPELLDNAVEEMLRYDSPVQGTVRVATEPLTLGEHEIGAGAFVVCSIGAANRDPAVHAEPDRFDVARSKPQHLSFGVGTHFCLGASLARLEGRAAFEGLIRRAAKLERVDESLEYRPNPILRGLRKLPLRLAPAPPATAGRP